MEASSDVGKGGGPEMRFHKLGYEVIAIHGLGETDATSMGNIIAHNFGQLLSLGQNRSGFRSKTVCSRS